MSIPLFIDYSVWSGFTEHVLIVGGFPLELALVRISLPSTRQLRIELTRPPAAPLPTDWGIATPDNLDPLIVEIALDGAVITIETVKELGVYPGIGTISHPALTTPDGTSGIDAGTWHYRAIAVPKNIPITAIVERSVDLAQTRYDEDYQLIVAGGDYTLYQSLRDYVERLIYTHKESFAWAPDWGVGVQPKKLYSPVDIATLKRDIETALLAVPFIANASVSISTDNRGIMTITVKLKPKKLSYRILKFVLPTGDTTPNIILPPGGTITVGGT